MPCEMRGLLSGPCDLLDRTLTGTFVSRPLRIFFCEPPGRRSRGALASVPAVFTEPVIYRALFLKAGFVPL